MLTADGAGRRMLSIGAYLPKSGTESLFFLVNERTGLYHLLKLTGDDERDAKRIVRLYRDAGRDVAETDIIKNLVAGRLQDEKDIREQKERAVRAGKNVASLAPPPALCVEPDITETGERIHGPAVSSSDGQWTTRCLGAAWARYETWEPAAYLFPVEVLNKTYTSGTWAHYLPAGTFDAQYERSCWANPFTFAGTSWYTTWCYRPPPTVSYSYLDISTTGQYVNTDFSYYVFGVFRPVSITASASIQSYYGTSIYGGQYYEDTQNWLAQWYEPFLLSGRLFGSAWGDGDCWTYCDPPWSTIQECENREIPGTWDFDLCQCVGGYSPIIVDLEDDGLALTNSEDGVSFDLPGTGQPIAISWTKPGAPDAFLALDRNKNGTIENGLELFGNFTDQPEPAGKKSQKNGFAALAVYDDPAHGGNNDGQITEADAIFTDLRLWVDLNHDGVSQADELLTTESVGLRALSLHYVPSKQVDEYGNLLRYRAHTTLDKYAFSPGRMKRLAVDVFLSRR
jgi:hypothetical protein